MNDFQTATIRHQVIRALKLAGAVLCRVTRTERDVNGMPTGKTLEVCTLYGLAYRRASQLANLLTIAMPGVTLPGAEDSRWCGLVMTGGMPQTGDVLRMDAGRAGRQIILAQNDLGVITMTLGGVTE